MQLERLSTMTIFDLQTAKKQIFIFEFQNSCQTMLYLLKTRFTSSIIIN